MGYIVAVDSGGTFSDCVIIDEKGKLTSAKAPSTPKDFSLGIVDSAKRGAELLSLSTAQLLRKTDIFGHGTTVATNALLTRSGAKTGLITTKGFEDTLIIGRIHQKVAGLSESEIINVAELDKVEPIVPRSMIRGVTERVDFSGEIIVPLNLDEVRQAVKSLADGGTTAIAVVLLWSFINPKHELEIRKIIGEMYPDIFITTSSELTPTIKEYERTATICINAYLGRVTADYIAALDRKLKDSGFNRSFMIMQAMGGFMSAQEACERPITTLSSGPVGGVIASKALADAMGYKNVITTDVGGTSFDVGLVIAGEAEFATAPVFTKYRLSLPMVDIVSIGAGGGSIARIEPSTRLLKVGPQSAGADPGPVCYGTGGTEPTVTDADFILNRYDTDYFLGGKMRIYRDKAVRAMKEKIAGPLGMNEAEAAVGVVDIIDSRMADLVRKVTIGRGYDPRDFILFAFGGAGPSHVGSYGRDVGAKYAVIPYLASVFSAFGIATSDVVHIKELSAPMTFPLDAEKAEAIYAKLTRELMAVFHRDGFQKEQIISARSMDIRYKGQVHEVRTPIPTGDLKSAELEKVVTAFERAYEDKYGKGTAYKAAGIEAMTYRVSGIGRIMTPPLTRYEVESPDSSKALKGSRMVFFKDLGGFHQTRVYDRDRLRPGNMIEGPALVEAVDNTTVIHPGQQVRVDEYLSLIMQLS